MVSSSSPNIQGAMPPLQNVSYTSEILSSKWHDNLTHVENYLLIDLTAGGFYDNYRRNYFACICSGKKRSV